MDGEINPWFRIPLIRGFVFPTQKVALILSVMYVQDYACNYQ